MRQQHVKTSRILFWCLLLLLLSLIFIRYVFQIAFPREVLLLIAVLIAVLGDGDAIIALCICCIPLYTSMQYTFTVGICLIAYFLKYWRSIRINLSILPIFLLVAWELLHCFSGGFSPEPFVGSFVPFALAAVLMCSGDRQFDYGFIVRAFAAATSAMCIVLLGKLLAASGYNVLLAVANLRRLGLNQRTMSVTGAELNPNTLGVLCVLCITGLLQLRISKEAKKSDIFIVLLLLVFGALSSSRTYLVCLAIMALLLLFSQQGGPSKKIRYLLSIAAFSLVALLVMQLFFPDVLRFYISRFQSDDITTGRDTLFITYMRFILSNPTVAFFGIGLYQFDSKITSVYNVASHVPHNGIQELWIAWGLPGLILFALFLTTMVWRSRRIAKEQGLLNFIPLLVLLAKSQAGQMLNSPYTMLAFSFTYLSLAHPFRLQQKKDKS